MEFLNILKKEVCFEIPEDLYKNKNILSFVDIYDSLGIENCINSIIAKTKESKLEYSNIRANEKTIQKLYDLVKENVLKSKKKNFLTEKVKETACAMDFLMYSPYTDSSIKDNTIIILKPNNKNYKIYEGKNS